MTTHEKYAEAPLDVEQEMALGDRDGERDWFDLNRLRQPLDREAEAAGCIGLDREVLEEGSRIDAIESFTPDNAPVFVGGPRALARPQPRTLRRFNGAVVEPAVFTQIYDGESRQVYSDTSAPWVWVGQLNTSSGSGTAALVGHSTILTAAHVVERSWSPGGPVRGNVTFTPAMFNGSSALGPTWTARVIGIAAWEQFVGQDGYDMAICQLDQPFGTWLGAFGYRTYSDNWEDRHVWAHAGYPYDLSGAGNWPCFELGISVHDDDSDSYDTLELETRADIASGQSGGPLWGRWENGGHQVIGTLSGREDNFAEEKNSLFAGGNGLSRLISWGRTNWG